MENHSYNLARYFQGLFFIIFRNSAETWLEKKSKWYYMALCQLYFLGAAPSPVQLPAHRPFTGMSDCMYQNVTIMPLVSRHGDISHVCLIIYDVTDAATSKIALEEANQQRPRFPLPTG